MPGCWIEVNLDAIRHNVRAIQELVGAATALIAVVKANAYGHGAIEVARTLTAEGVPQLAVTRLEEALPLRAAGILTPILLLVPALADEVEAVVSHGLTACLSSYEDAKLLADAATVQQTRACAHLKINTGMGRLGVEPEEAVETARRIAELPNLELEGVFTHFAQAAGSGQAAATVHRQFAQFQSLINPLQRVANIAPENFHCANSAALLRFPEMRLSCVRPGTILYGQYPTAPVAQAGARQKLKLRDPFAAKARIVAIKNFKVGQPVGYGSEWRAQRPSRIATIPVGYADGLAQEPQTRSATPRQVLRDTVRQTTRQVAQWIGLKAEDAARTALVRGARVPIIGRIAMQQCSLDITDVPEVCVGDEVTVFMRRTSAGAHLPRLYVSDS